MTDFVMKIHFTPEQIQTLLGTLSDEVLIPKCFFRSDVQEILNIAITPDQYDAFREHCTQGDMASDVSALLKEWWAGFLEASKA